MGFLKNLFVLHHYINVKHDCINKYKYKDKPINRMTNSNWKMPAVILWVANVSLDGERVQPIWNPSLGTSNHAPTIKVK